MKENLIPLKVPIAALAILGQSKNRSPFSDELLKIAQGCFVDSSLEDPFEKSAIITIAEATKSSHNKRVAAGKEGLKARFSNTAAPISIPEIVPPVVLQNKDYYSKTIAAALIAKIRYCMLSRNFKAVETHVFLNYTVGEAIKLNNAAGIDSDLILTKAQSWNNYNRGQRFPCRELHQFIMQVMKTANPAERGWLLDLSMDSESNENDITIIACRETLAVLLKYYNSCRDVFDGTGITLHYRPSSRYI